MEKNLGWKDKDGNYRIDITATENVSDHADRLKERVEKLIII